jgi:hypothetical protein
MMAEKGRCRGVQGKWVSQMMRNVVSGVASRQTRVERGWFMRRLLPWNCVGGEVGAVAVAVQAMWMSRSLAVRSRWVSRRSSERVPHSHGADLPAVLKILGDQNGRLLRPRGLDDQRIPE